MLVPNNVLRTVRRVAVTSLREPVLVVSLDTKDQGAMKVSDRIFILTKTG